MRGNEKGSIESNKGKHTESTEGDDYVKPILLDEGLFGDLYHGITGGG